MSHVFVTGATGFIAKHIVARLLNAGHSVTGSVRALGRADEVRDAVRPALDDETALGNLSFAALDLTRDEGWEAALAGHDALIHTASPFPLEQPKDEEKLIRPAVDGALRALRAARAAGIDNVVLTSSCVAIMHRDGPQEGEAYTEADWTDLDHPTSSAYVKSKTKAEQAAWDFVESEGRGMKLAAVNPGLVLGPPLDGQYGTSVEVVERILRARDPMQPRIGFPVVDVRDVAEMHLRAMERDGAKGKRFIAAERFMWFSDLAELLAQAYPDRGIKTRTAPNFLIRGMALFDRSVRGILPSLGRRTDVSNAQARKVLGIDFIPAEEAALAAADFIVSHGKV